MLKKILDVMKKIIFSILLLYGYNMIATPINVMIPINFITIGAVTILGFPALFALIIINIVVF
ncbi:MAG: pro-sigmaK processing inhibitor BofA family protein [Tenericutes bacterium]|nr:pro-sigmaK processing inhibitor BofA family protein [Mycoplasmatota bacterium]